MERVTEFREWTVGDYLARVKKKEIDLPKFQRGISWSAGQQARLISSIRQGFPIGAVLLAKKSEPNGSQYSIIDGLQRTTALSRFSEDPRSFIGTADHEFDEDWRAFVRWVSKRCVDAEISQTDIDGFLHAYLRSVDGGDFDTHELYRAIESQFHVPGTELLKDPELRRKSKALFESMREAFDISQCPIPVILYSGETRHLPEIFERLNSQGVKLSKYQIFAASWQKHFPFENQELRTATRDFYLSRLEESDINIDGVEQDGLPTELTLFDYLTGLSSVLVNRFPLLFAPGWSSHIAYGIACVAHGCAIGKMAELEDRFARLPDGRPATERFASALLAVCEDVQRALSGRLSLRLNSSSDQAVQYAQHTEFQISTIVTRLMVEAFNPHDWSEKEPLAIRRERDQLVRRWYFYDRLREAWGNAGDSQFYRLVWDLLGDKLTPRRTTLEPPSDEDLVRVLDAWYEQHMKSRDRVRVNVVSETKMVLRYFYSSRHSVKHEKEHKFELDHIVPISWWRKFFAVYKDDPVNSEEACGPINSIGNLCLMTTKDHDSKGTKPPFDWFKEHSDGGDDPNFSARCRDLYFLIDESSFRYPEIPGKSLKDLDPSNPTTLAAVKEGLLETSRERWKIMKAEILTSLTIH